MVLHQQIPHKALTANTSSEPCQTKLGCIELVNFLPRFFNAAQFGSGYKRKRSTDFISHSRQRFGDGEYGLSCGIELDVFSCSELLALARKGQESGFYLSQKRLMECSIILHKERVQTKKKASIEAFVTFPIWLRLILRAHYEE